VATTECTKPLFFKACMSSSLSGHAKDATMWRLPPL
jgi:hypothetical protein